MIGYHIYKALPLSLKISANKLAQQIIKPRLRTHFAHFIHPGDLVFDVGAYVGDYTEIFLELGATVVSIDPQPFSIQKLRTKFGKNPHVSIVNKGVGEISGLLPFYISSNSRTNSTFYSSWKHHPRYIGRKWDKNINVPVTTMDSLIDEFGVPQFCKIDVEGFEPQVIHGLHQIIPFLSFEFDQAFMNHVRNCVEHLTNLGRVKFNYALYGGSALDSDRWLNSNQLLRTLRGKVNGHLRGDIYAMFTG